MNQVKRFYRRSYDVVGFTYWADIYCKPCGDSLPETDPEGNTKHALFVCNLDDLQGRNSCECGDDVERW